MRIWIKSISAFKISIIYSYLEEEKDMDKRLKKIITLVLTFAIICGSIYIPYGSSDKGMNVVEAAGATPVAAHGRLRVNGTQLVDQYGEAFQLRGVSTHGLQWYSQYNNQASFQTLRDDWGANAIRLAMYTEGGNGYCQGNASSMKQQVVNGVQAATNLGMYAIIDWHILSDGNPNSHKSEAISFFNEMSAKYKNNNNVIYEICNEPNGGDVTWDLIKTYAVDIINTIRRNDPNAVIVVGTPSWSQLSMWGHTTEVADNPITGQSNIMYALHFYASDNHHNQYVFHKIADFEAKGLPIMVTEFGLSQASGNGNVDTSLADKWLNECDKYNISYFCWSLCNKNESSALIKSSCSKTSGWSAGELSTAGQYIRNRYINRKNALEVVNTPAPSEPGQVTVAYWTHIQGIGWAQGWQINGASAGTTGSSKRLEGIKIEISNKMGTDLGIKYRTHIQGIGWQDWRSDGVMSGTSGQSKRLEAIQLELTGAAKDNYDVYYRVHAQNYGWLGWAKNGEVSGTSGQSKRLESIEVKVVPRGSASPGNTSYRYIEYGYESTNTSNQLGLVNYGTHVQGQGNQNYVYDGSISGSFGKSKRLEGIWLNLQNGIDGGITYSTHIQGIGWQDWRSNGDMSGTSGQSKRLEAIQIQLTGNAVNNYDVYYRVHAQTYGWLGWAKNGECAGTAGYSKRLEAIQVVLLPKGSAAPLGSGQPAYYQR